MEINKKILLIISILLFLPSVFAIQSYVESGSITLQINLTENPNPIIKQWNVKNVNDFPVEVSVELSDNLKPFIYFNQTNRTLLANHSGSFDYSVYMETNGTYVGEIRTLFREITLEERNQKVGVISTFRLIGYGERPKTPLLTKIIPSRGVRWVMIITISIILMGAIIYLVGTKIINYKYREKH